MDGAVLVIDMHGIVLQAGISSVDDAKDCAEAWAAVYDLLFDRNPAEGATFKEVPLPQPQTVALDES